MAEEMEEDVFWALPHQLRAQVEVETPAGWIRIARYAEDNDLAVALTKHAEES